MLMSTGKHIFLILIAAIIIVLESCRSTSYETVYPTLSDGKYDSEFPYRNCSEQLEEIASSLVKLDVLVFYETYTFSLPDGITFEQLRKADPKPDMLGGTSGIFTESVGGTAISIYNANGRMAFLSCAHIVDYPDTVINYYPPPNNKYIEVVGIKARQQNSISTLSEGGNLEVLAIDSKSDIVLLGKQISEPAKPALHVINYPLGNSEELEWGSFVYIMGYPLGHSMITRGIVSDPGRIKKGTFLIDAVFNKGFSGGPVIAVRDGVPNFEIVGMVRSSAATGKYYLAPANSEKLPQMNFKRPYEGELQLISEKEIKYGITFSVTTASLRSFYKKYRTQLFEKGYDPALFFGNTD